MIRGSGTAMQGRVGKVCIGWDDPGPNSVKLTKETLDLLFLWRQTFYLCLSFLQSDLEKRAFFFLLTIHLQRFNALAFNGTFPGLVWWSLQTFSCLVLAFSPWELYYFVMELVVTSYLLVCLFVCLLLNDTSALFRPLVPRIVQVEHTSLHRALKVLKHSALQLHFGHLKVEAGFSQATV